MVSERIQDCHFSVVKVGEESAWARLCTNVQDRSGSKRLRTALRCTSAACARLCPLEGLGRKRGGVPTRGFVAE